MVGLKRINNLGCYFLFGFSLLLFFEASSQTIQLERVEDDFENYVNLPEENIHVHLNKNIFVEGEDIAFASYVINTKTQKPSLDTKNIYAQLINENNQVVKEQMICSDQGKSYGIFKIDSKIPAGNYNLKVFTNWMRNFDNPLYALKAIRVVKNEYQSLVTSDKNNSIDIQLYPESGYAIHNILTRIGLMTTDNYGNSVNGELIISDGSYTQKIPFDKTGITSFNWLPNKDKTYSAKAVVEGKSVAVELPAILTQGVHLDAKIRNNELGIGISTNTSTAANFESSKFGILINGHSSLQRSIIELVKDEVNFTVPLTDLDTGINQITLVDNKGNIIAKRLFFNHHNFEYIKDANIQFEQGVNNDYINLELDKSIANVSVSVLPAQSLSYTPRQSILTKFKFAPYLKDRLNDIDKYFPLDNSEDIHRLDSYLICTGWELYDWNEVQNLKNQYFRYPFEQGITVQGQLNNRKFNEVLIYPTANNQVSLATVDQNNNAFTAYNFFPEEDDQFRISGLNDIGKAANVGVSPTFSPNYIPTVGDGDFLAFSPTNKASQSFQLIPFVDGSTQLDLVTLNAVKETERKDRIINENGGRIDYFDDRDRKRYYDIRQYLLQQGFNSSIEAGVITDLEYFNTERFRPFGSAEPVFILDGIIVFTTQFLIGFDMSTVDYIQIDNSGDARIFGKVGVPIITIETDPSLKPKNTKASNMSTFDIPLKFSTPKEFYRPKYYSVNSEMFKKLGVIDWQANLNIQDGKAAFVIPKSDVNEVKVIIEGIAPDGTLIHTIKNVEKRK